MNNIIEESVENYEIPENIKNIINKKFLTQFYEELHCISGIGLDDFEMDSIFYTEGTSAFSTALYNVCKKLKLIELIKYLRTLDWVTGDLFDDYLVDRLKEEKMIIPDFEDDEIKRQFNIDDKDVKQCNLCGKYFHKEDVVDFIDYETGEPLSCSECLNCQLEQDKVTPIEINRNKAIQYHLGLNENDYFYCKSCHKYHLNKFKKNDKCHYCNIMEHSSNKNANYYYLRALKSTAKWLSNIK